MNLHVFDGRLKDVCIDQQQIGRLPEKRASINFKQQKLDTATEEYTKNMRKRETHIIRNNHRRCSSCFARLQMWLPRINGAAGALIEANRYFTVKLNSVDTHPRKDTRLVSSIEKYCPFL